MTLVIICHLYLHLYLSCLASHCDTKNVTMHSAICAVISLSNRAAGLNSQADLWVIYKCA
jgi:hypothetical protein